MINTIDEGKEKEPEFKQLTDDLKLALNDKNMLEIKVEWLRVEIKM